MGSWAGQTKSNNFVNKEVQFYSPDQILLIDFFQEIYKKFIS